MYRDEKDHHSLLKYPWNLLQSNTSIKDSLMKESSKDLPGILPVDLLPKNSKNNLGA